jgi:hypothetical protein
MKAQAKASIGQELDTSSIAPFVEQVSPSLPLVDSTHLNLNSLQRPNMHTGDDDVVMVMRCHALQVEEIDYAAAKTDAEYHSNVHARINYIASQLKNLSVQLAVLTSAQACGLLFALLCYFLALA